MRNRLDEWFKSRVLARSSIDNRYALIEACLIGILSGLAALLLKQGIGWLGGWRIKTAYEYGAIITLPITGLVFGTLAGWAIEILSPAAAGGGIPQVKAALARYPMPLNLRVALVKAVGTILVLGAGLTLGRRGPTVHIGAALAAQLSSWIPNSPTNRRQMIAAGAAAGLAAGFNTPIAGVLFVVEELMRDVSGLTLETAIVASFTGSVVSRSLGSADLNIPATMLRSSQQSSFAAREIPFYIVLGILAGLLGVLFNHGILYGIKLNRQLKIPMPFRMGLAGLISGIIIAFLPAFFRDNSGLREFLISGGLSWQAVAIAFSAHFFLTILAYSCGAPGGLFAPALVMGSALGYLVGMAEVNLIASQSPYTFALAGMGAFFTAVVRVPVTAIVIVFEMTTDFNLVLPLMIVSAVAYIVAESFHRGSIYQHLLSASGIQLQEDAPNYDFLAKLKAVDVMQSQVETLSSSLTVEEAMKAISRSSHRGFPVMEEGALVGIITQSDLATANKKNDSILLKEIMTARPITANPTTSLGDVLYLLNRYQLSRLPVTQGSKLIGIITQSDIIKAEVQQLSGDREVTAKPEPSYVAYRTRSPATGRGRILLPLSNPENASNLLQIAIAIARYQKYEIDCLQVISVPKYIYPAQAQIDLTANRTLMARLEQSGQKHNIPIHTQIRIANDTAEAILEAIAQEQINLLLMGWKGSTSSPDQIFGSVVDTLIKQAPCDLMLVKLGQKPYSFPHKLDRQGLWLIPTAGGANTQKALKILPGLANFSGLVRTPKIKLCQIYSPTQSDLPLQHLSKTAAALRDKINLPVTILPIRAYSVSETIIRLTGTEKYDLILIGATSEGLLQNAVRGNIPEEIARKVDTTVIIFRNAL
ncbi:Chloride channel core [Stanieria sp. NIES-3757]|nr:Chloride channel core [Stanieria sp. NIES-3757]